MEKVLKIQIFILIAFFFVQLGCTKKKMLTSDIDTFNELYADLVAISHKGKSSSISITPVFLSGKLVKLSLSGIYLDSLPSSISKFQDLSALSISLCHISTFGSLNNKQVETLILSHNEFVAIPNIKKSFPNTKYLDLSHNRIEGVINFLKISDSIVEINLSNNKILYVNGGSVKNKLSLLDLSFNKIKLVDPMFCKFKYLGNMNVAHNKVDSILLKKNINCFDKFYFQKDYID